MRLLIVTGLPATGKTTLARNLARRYGVALICKDTIKESLLDTLGTGGLAHSRRLSDMSFEMMFALAQDSMAAEADLLLEGNFRAGEHEEPLRTWAPPRTAQILCRIEEPERRARLATRSLDSARHPGHRDAALATVDTSIGRFLDLPGPRFIFESVSSADHEQAVLIQEIDSWWQRG